jgi:hypothetical protein
MTTRATGSRQPRSARRPGIRRPSPPVSAGVIGARQRIGACCPLSSRQRIDAAGPVVNAERVTLYDKLDWHFDSAVSAGHPPENAFTHIGFYLVWLIRRDLHNPRMFPSQHLDAVKRGEMSGSDLADDIDTKLVSQVMNDEGRAFSDGRYVAYTAAYGDLFKDVPDYGVVDRLANYEQVERLLDGIYAEWVSEGRPPAHAATDSDRPVPTSTSVTLMVPTGFSQEQIDELVGQRPPGEVTVMRPPIELEMPHVAPDLEALIPRDLTSPPMRVHSVRATDWRSSVLNRALKRLDVRPKDAVVVNGLGGSGGQTLSVSIYGVPDVPADRLANEFTTVIHKWPGSKWATRDIAGRSVNWAVGKEFTVGYWTRDGMVLHVAGEAAAVERAITRLP